MSAAYKVSTASSPISTLSPLSVLQTHSPVKLVKKESPFHESALYKYSLAAITNTDPVKPPRPTGPQVLGWATLAWFIGAVSTFASEQLLPFAQDLKKGLHPSAVSLMGMALDIERVFMGTAAVLMTINAIWILKKRKQELAAINSLEDKKNQRTNTALWIQAAEDLKLLVLTPVVAITAVILNTIRMIAPMLKTGIFHVFGAIGGCLFSLIEAFQLYNHAKAAHQHTKHLRALRGLQKTSDETDSNAIASQEKISAETMLKSLHSNDSKDELALKAMTDAFTRMKRAGFEMSTPLTKEQWIDKAIITHSQERKSQVIKSVIHGLIGMAMVTAFAGGHVFTLGALALGAALWATVATLAVRLGVAITPERKILNRSLNKPPLILFRAMTSTKINKGKGYRVVPSINPDQGPRGITIGSTAFA